MSATAKCQAVLKRLLADGSLPESGCSRTLLRFMSPLVSGEVLAWEKSGAGRRLTVRNPAALVEFIKRQFPKSEAQVANAAPRVQGAARFRDTKRLRGTGEEIICVRGWRDGVLLQHGQAVPVVEPTRWHGLLAFLLRADSDYQLHGRIATVENPTVFTSFERLQTEIPLALYTRGRLSRRVLTWLALQAADGLEIVHFGDYDPVGLDEYRKLLGECGGNVSLYLPPNISQLFHTYGNPALLRRAKSQVLLQRLRAVEDPSLKNILTLIDETNACLEHEVLLIDSDAVSPATPSGLG